MEKKKRKTPTRTKRLLSVVSGECNHPAFLRLCAVEEHVQVPPEGTKNAVGQQKSLMRHSLNCKQSMQDRFLGS